MARPRASIEHRPGDPAHADMEHAPDDISLGEQLIREAREGHAEFVAGWSMFMEELGVQGKPIGAKRLRESLLQAGFNPDGNEFSRGIIAMREE